MNPPVVELISTGAELLSGRTVNRHAATLGGRLAPLGLSLSRDTTLPDDRAVLTAAVRDALTRCDLLLVSGGLGPTNDDLTREAVADALGRGLSASPEGVGMITARLRLSGRVPGGHSLRQALLIEGGRLLANSAGVAPGQQVELPDGKTVFLLPGPPREFDAVLEEQVLPWLRGHVAATPPYLRTFMFCGVGESDIHTFLEPLVQGRAVDLAYCAAPGRVEVRLSTPGDPGPVDALAAELRGRFAENLYSERPEGLAETVARLLGGSGKTLAVAESCTGGLLGGRITSVPGSSSFFLGGVIAYDNRVKTALLGVPPGLLETVGAVSAETASHMARGVRERLGSTYGLAITGVAGPGGGTGDKPVGLVWTACAGPRGCLTRRMQSGGSREMVREHALQRTLWLLWSCLTFPGCSVE